MNSSIYFHKTEIAVLLLDVENLRFNIETEKFLTTICTHPIQVKIAFANWSSMGKLDVELHGRGYDLIHVPAGRDNADGKMIAFGSLIHERYPNAKEVLVCSSDQVMTNLCNHLQQHGLTVYRVSKQGSNITIINTKSSEKFTYSIVKLPSIAEFIKHIKDIIVDEEARTSNQWITLSKITEIFHTKYKVGIDKVISHHFPSKTAKDIFTEQSEFVVHQPTKESQIYIALFKIPEIKNTNNNISANNNTLKTQVISSINSSQDLEKALINIMSARTTKAPANYILLETLGAEVHKQYGEGITKILKRLKLKGNFIKFLQSSNTFKLEKKGKSYGVSRF